MADLGRQQLVANTGENSGFLSHTNAITNGAKNDKHIKTFIFATNLEINFKYLLTFGSHSYLSHIF